MKKYVKARLNKFVLSRLYSGEELSTYVSDAVLAEAIFAKGMIQYRTNPEIFDSLITSSYDPVRFSVLATAIDRLERNKIKGSFAEAGVYQGYTSRIVHSLAPSRKFYLFDSFEGFRDSAGDDRFKDTSVETVLAKLGNSPNVVAVKGYIPETLEPYQSEEFALVILDVDKYEPTMAGLKFFYPRLVGGGYIFLHDYNSSESDWGVKRATDEYIAKNEAVMMDIPDMWGSLALCKPIKPQGDESC